LSISISNLDAAAIRSWIYFSAFLMKIGFYIGLLYVLTLLKCILRSLLSQERRFLEHSQRSVPKKNRIPDAGGRSIPICHRVAFLPGYSTASAVRQTHTFRAFHLLGNSIARISFHFGGLYI